MRRHARGTVVLAGALVLALAARAHGGGLQSFEVEGSCVQASTGFVVDADRARRYVPARFPVLEVAGRTLVAAWGADCRISVEGGPVVPAFLGGVLVFLEEEGAVYDVTATTSSPEFNRWASRLDLGELVRRARAEYRSVADTVVPFRVTVPGGHSPFHFEGILAEAPVDALAAPLHDVHWFQGRYGAVRAAYEHTFTDIGAGTAVLRAAPGSPLADMLGAEEAEGPATLFRFHFSGAPQLEG